MDSRRKRQDISKLPNYLDSKSVSYLFDYAKADMLLSNYLDKAKQLKAQILEHQRNSPRHSNFFDDKRQRATLETDNNADCLMMQPKTRRGSMPISVTVATK